MKIAPRPRPLTPAPIPRPPAPTVRPAVQATPGDSAVAPVSVSHIQAVGSLQAILGMAGPDSGTAADMLSSPFLTSLRLGPWSPPKDSGDVGRLYAPDGDEVLTPDATAFAAQMVNQLGSNGAVSLDEAERALEADASGTGVNRAETVARLFGRVDGNGDGVLSQGELTRLMGYYMRNITPTGPMPKLPGVRA